MYVVAGAAAERVLAGAADQEIADRTADEGVVGVIAEQDVVAAGLVLAADAKDDRAKDELKKLHGTWALQSGEKEGKKLSDDDLKRSKITWKGTEYALIAPHLSVETIKGTTSIVEATKKPYAMDWKRETGADKGKTLHTIYEWINEDEFGVCSGAGDQERPKEFATKPGSGQFLHVDERSSLPVGGCARSLKTYLTSLDQTTGARKTQG